MSYTLIIFVVESDPVGVRVQPKRRGRGKQRPYRKSNPCRWWPGGAEARE